MIDYRALLPSAARRALVEELLQKMEGARLDFYGDPSYLYESALKDFQDGVWVREHLRECFELARSTYRAHHPKQPK